jgi:muconolactone D-isomerase
VIQTRHTVCDLRWEVVPTRSEKAGRGGGPAGELRVDLSAPEEGRPAGKQEAVKEFLVEITTTVPEGTDPAEVQRRRAAEAVRARELAGTGHLVRLWRPVDAPRSIGIWKAADETELQEKVLGTLPLRTWMTLAVTPLESHPNDPGKADATD